MTQDTEENLAFIGKTLFALAIIVGIVWMVHDSNRVDAENNVRAQQLSRAWIAYADVNCKVIAQTYGATARIGKVNAVLSGDTLLCSDGIQRTVGMDLDSAMRSCAKRASDCQYKVKSDEVPIPPTVNVGQHINH